MASLLDQASTFLTGGSTAQQAATAQANKPLEAPVPVEISSQKVNGVNLTDPATPVSVQESLSPGETIVNPSSYEDPALKKVEESSIFSLVPSPSKIKQGLAAKFPTIMSGVDSVRQAPKLNTPRNQKQKDDWRLRLSLASTAKYLYKDPNIKGSDLLYPLTSTDGVVFPYMPTINTSYKANYDPSDLTHSNYKTYFYKNSSVEEITVTAEFTAQDTAEANYMLAVIHFFKSVTKMFYGQDGKNGGPRAGTPPPLCYLSGLGMFQFNDHPVLISSFTYNLPNDVDYIRAGSGASIAGQNTSASQPKESPKFGFDLASVKRLFSSGLTKGAISPDPNSQKLSNENSTYVPTKLQITLTLLPVVTRNDVSKNFSVEEYATGKLLKGSQRNGRGIW